MKDRIRVAALAAIVVVSSIILVLNVDSRKNPQPLGEVEGASTLSNENVEQVSLTVDSLTSRPVYTTEYIPGESAFDLMQRIDREDDNLSFVFADTSFGKFVKAINGIEADGNTQFWLFRVNESDSTEGVEGYQLHNGDKLLFQLTNIRP